MLQALQTSPRAWRPLAALAVGVLMLHAVLLARWSGAMAPSPGLAVAGSVRPVAPPVVHLLARLQRPGPSAAPLPADDSATGPGDASPAPGIAAGTGAGSVPPRKGPTLLPAALGGPLGPVAGRKPPGPAAAPLAILSAAGQGAEPGAQAAAEDAAEGAAAAAPPAAPSGEPPPLYPAQPPAAADLRYALHYYGHSGDAVLHWRPSGATYSLQLQGLPSALASGPATPLLVPARVNPRAGGRPLIEQASQGQLDANGLVPDRFTDRRRGRGQRAANFRRELGRIEFSGPATVQPAWPGAQDRLSWWVQLPAIVAAAASVPAEVRLFVVDARGRGELLRFEFLGEVVLPAATGQAALQYWRHEPSQAEGQRMELWLDPAQGHWPVQLRLSSQRSGERFELRLLAIDSAPP